MNKSRKLLQLGNFCLVQKSPICPYTGDAKQSDPWWHVQGPVPRVHFFVVDRRAAAAVRGAAAASPNDLRDRVDPRLGLSCGGRGGDPGRTHEAIDRQRHYRWGLVATTGLVAAHGLRAIDGGGTSAQGQSRRAPGRILSRAAAVRRRWQPLFGDQYPAGQKANAQGQDSAGERRFRKWEWR